jgi:hypothetical protein
MVLMVIKCSLLSCILQASATIHLLNKCSISLSNLVLVFFFFLKKKKLEAIFFFFDLRGCPGQLARTTTNLTAHWTPCKPSGYVRHRGGDRRAHEDSNPGAVEGDKPLPPPGQDPQREARSNIVFTTHGGMIVFVFCDANSLRGSNIHCIICTFHQACT